MEIKNIIKPFSIFISFAVGLMSLSEEIIWVRIFSFLSHSVPQAFSYILFLYIAGIAAGALKGPKLLNKNLSPFLIVALIFIISGIFVGTAPLIINISANQFFLLPVVSVLIFSSAFLKGLIFPLVHDWFSELGANLGRSLSFVYVSNLLGSSLGPMLVGFFLLDIFPAFTLLVIFGLIEIFIGLLILLSLSRYRYSFVIFLGLMLLFFPYKFIINYDFTSKFISKYLTEDERVSSIIENKHGIIYSISQLGRNDDIVYGGNVYDGSFNINLSSNSNGIDRVYMLAGMHDKPEKVLVIGLSTGSWLRVVSAFPDVEQIDVVEINQGYEQLIRNHNKAGDIFNDPRIKYHYMDGRQFVVNAAAINKKYDMIVMNTTWHWRVYSTNLLSADFLEKLKNIMNPGAVMAFNSTRSIDVMNTARHVFGDAFIFSNFVYVSDKNLSNIVSANESRYCQLIAEKIDGQSCDNDLFWMAVEKLKNQGPLTWQQFIELKPLTRDPEIVTDKNMITEYKYGIKMTM